MALGKWGLTLAALAYVLKEIDAAALSDMMRTQQYSYLLLAISLLILQAIISTLRWQRIITLLKPDGMAGRGMGHLLSLNFISMFFNCCLPGTVGGDVLRALMLRSPHMPISLATHSVVIDRIFAVLAIFAMVAFGMPWLAPLLSLPFPMLWVVLVVLGFLLLGPMMRRFDVWFSRYNRSRPVAMLKNLTHSLLRIQGRTSWFYGLLLQAVFAHLLYCGAVWAIAASLSVEFSFLHAGILIPPMLLVSLLPVSIGGWGVRELAMVYLLAKVGIEKEAALLISVQLGIWMMVASLPGLYLWLVRKKVTL